MHLVILLHQGFEMDVEHQTGRIDLPKRENGEILIISIIRQPQYSGKAPVFLRVGLANMLV